jgi:asparagine synthase (glutamine-hydrolysing)
MCGIAGMLQLDGAIVSEQILHRMNEAMRHRGPDGAGIFAKDSIGISMTRLAIIDVAGGQQPIFNEDESIAIVCNGEIYNHVPLRQRLERTGHRFRTHSDVEVILHLYEEHGQECFSFLNGMFGAAIADFRKQRIVLGRDPFGQKSLYIWRMDKSFAFASELKALASLPGFPRKISHAALASYLQYRYITAPSTIWEGVQKLPPGSSYSIDASGGTETRRYWQINYAAAARAERTSGSKLLENLTGAVERHLMSERPLGVFLSGGLDSSAVLACMHLSGHRDILTYTIGFEGFADNEFATARAVAGKFKTNHHEVSLGPEEFWDTLDSVVYASDEPLADLTTVPLYHLSMHARKDVVVVLSGEGSDELLAGYGGMETLRRNFDRLHRLAPLRPFARYLAKISPTQAQARLKVLAGGDCEYLARHPMVMAPIFDGEFRRRHSLNGFSALDPVRQLVDYYRSRPDWDGIGLYLGAMTEWWLPDDLLHKADRMTMAHSLELRCPFLDTEFAEYCIHLGVDDKVLPTSEEPCRKVALKRAFESILPKGIAYQRKKGFTLPAYEWLQGPLAAAASQIVMREDLIAASIFPRSVRSTLLAQAGAGDSLSQRQVWSLIVLNKWAKRWL